jgi:hypothetical protein
MILASIVLFTLILAIARQRSEQFTVFLFPESFGIPYANRGWDKGIPPQK